LTDFSVTNLFNQPTAFHTHVAYSTRQAFGRLFVCRF